MKPYLVGPDTAVVVYPASAIHQLVEHHARAQDCRALVAKLGVCVACRRVVINRTEGGGKGGGGGGNGVREVL